MENPFIENLATGTCTLPMPMCQRILILLLGLCGQALSKGQATTLETLNLATKIQAAQRTTRYIYDIYLYTEQHINILFLLFQTDPPPPNALTDPP